MLDGGHGERPGDLPGRIGQPAGHPCCARRRTTPGDELDLLIALAHETGAVDVQSAHSGNVAGLLFDPARAPPAWKLLAACSVQRSRPPRLSISTTTTITTALVVSPVGDPDLHASPGLNPPPCSGSLRGDRRGPGDQPPWDHIDREHASVQCGIVRRAYRQPHQIRHPHRRRPTHNPG